MLEQLKPLLRPGRGKEVSRGTPKTKESVARKPRGRQRLHRPAILLVVLACVCLCHRPVLRAVAGLLIVDQHPTAIDIIWIQSENGLNCDGARGYDHAASLYHEDTSRGVILTRPYPNRLVRTGVVPTFEEISRCELAARGVPEEAVTVLDGTAQNPWQEARNLGTWLEEHADADVLLLCDRFGSRRWQFILNTVLGQHRADAVKILALPDGGYDETNWWKSRSGVKDLFYRYVALVYAWCRITDTPERSPWDPDKYERILRRTAEEES